MCVLLLVGESNLRVANKLNFSLSLLSYCVPLDEGPLKYNLKIYTVVNFVLWYCVPLVLMVIAYGSISVVLWRTSTARTASEQFLRHGAPPQTTTGGGGGGGAEGGGSGGGAATTSGVNSGDAIATEMIEVYSLAASICGSLCNLSDTEVVEAVKRSSSTPTITQPHLSVALPVAVRPYQRRKRSSDAHCGPHAHEPLYKPKTPTSHQQQHGNPPPVEVPLINSGSKTKTGPNAAKVVNPTAKKRRAKVQNALVARRKVIRLLVTIVVWFAVCVLPRHVWALWSNFPPENFSLSMMIYVLMKMITDLLFYFNSCINPFLYAFLSDKFRQNLILMLKCKHRS